MDVIGLIFFQKSQLFSLSQTYYLIGVLCGHDFVYWLEDLRLSDLLDTSKMFVICTDNSLETLEKVSMIYMRENEAKMGLEYSDKNSRFKLVLFVLKASENFLWYSQTRSRYLKGRLICIFVSLKNCDHMIHQSNDMSGKVKKRDFEEIKLKMGLEDSNKTSCFDLKLFLQRLL